NEGRREDAGGEPAHQPQAQTGRPAAQDGARLVFQSGRLLRSRFQAQPDRKGARRPRSTGPRPWRAEGLRATASRKLELPEHMNFATERPRSPRQRLGENDVTWESYLDTAAEYVRLAGGGTNPAPQLRLIDQAWRWRKM